MEYQRRIFSKQRTTSSHYLRDWLLKLYDVAGVGVSSWSTLRGVFSINVGDKGLLKYYLYIEQNKIPMQFINPTYTAYDDIKYASGKKY